MKKQPVGFFILFAGIFLITAAIGYPQDSPEIKIQTEYSESIQSVAISSDGKTIVSGGWDRTVRLWDKENGQEIGIFKGHTGTVYEVVISADGKTIVSGGVIILSTYGIMRPTRKSSN